MDTKKIAIFLEAVKLGSLKKTAEKLNYTQSGLIYLVNSLENELGGVKLLNRTTKGVCLTEEGMALEPYIRELFERENELLSKIHEIKSEGTRKIRIGTYPIYACDSLPGVIKTFLTDYPENDITIQVATAQDLPKLLEADDIDLAIGEAGLMKDVEWVPLMDYEIYSAIPQEYEIEEEESVTFEELKNYPLLFSSYNQVSNQIEKLMERENPYKIKVESSDGSALLHMVSEGLGIAFLSSLYLKECPPTVKMRPLDPPIRKKLGVLAKEEKMKSPLLKAFLPYLQQNAKQNVQAS